MKLYKASLVLLLLAGQSTNAAADNISSNNNDKNLRTQRELNKTVIKNNKNKNKPPASNGSSVDVLPPQAIPSVDRAAVSAEDEINDANKANPKRFAIPNAVHVDSATDGKWSKAKDGTQIWQHRVKSPGCNSLNFGFTKYQMPEGGRLHIYDKKGKSSISRPFTSEDNSKSGELWTPVIESCDAIIEVNLDRSSDKDALQLVLTNVGAGYRGFRTRHESEHGKPRRELSGSCNIDVVCSEGNGWEAEIASVAVYSKGGSLACTGAMINDAESSGAPHFLTANHCGVSSSNAASVVAYWNYQSSSCVPGSTSGDGPLTQFSSGATHLVSNSQSDVTLIRLNDLPNPEYGVTYAGWDRSGNAATIAVAIHHPSCDEKRISFMYDTTAISGFFRSGDTHVRVADWDKGTTEPGSSGSPLFDQNHRIIGQLHGGSAACGNNLEDYYGRFFKSWTAGLAQYLDPTNTGKITVDTLGAVTTTPTMSPKPTQAPISLSACLGDPSNVEVQVDVTTDNYPVESSWSLVDNCGLEVSKTGGEFPASGTLYSKTLCVQKARYTFTMSDSYGDGTCCQYGEGSYVVKYNGVQQASGGSFGASETTEIGETACLPEGSPKPSPAPVTSAPVTPSPTQSPITPEPSKSPVTPKPTMSPVTPEPSKFPTRRPTNPPVVCLRRNARCGNNDDLCCSKNCKNNGKCAR